MSTEALNWVMDLDGLSSTEKHVLTVLANRAKDVTFLVWPSWARIMKDTGLCRKTIHKTLVNLQNKGFIMQTSETIKQVHIYKLLNVSSHKNPSKLSTTSSKITTGSKSTTRSKITTTTSSKITTGTRSNFTTQNHNENHKRNHNCENPDFFSKTPIKTQGQSQTQIQKQLQEACIVITEDLIAQIEFYVASRPEKAAQELIDVAVRLIGQRKWKIPHGFNGITSQSIAKAELEYEEKKKEQFKEDAMAYKNLAMQIGARDSTIVPDLIPTNICHDEETQYLFGRWNNKLVPHIKSEKELINFFGGEERMFRAFNEFGYPDHYKEMIKQKVNTNAPQRKEIIPKLDLKPNYDQEE